MKHVDDYIDDHRGDKYARYVLMLLRLPAVLALDFAEWTKQYELFCNYANKRYRVTGASRLGDIWLTSDFNRDCGYELRVDLNDCTAWGNKP